MHYSLPCKTHTPPASPGKLPRLRVAPATLHTVCSAFYPLKEGTGAFQEAKFSPPTPPQPYPPVWQDPKITQDSATNCLLHSLHFYHLITTFSLLRNLCCSEILMRLYINLHVYLVLGNVLCYLLCLWTLYVSPWESGKCIFKFLSCLEHVKKLTIKLLLLLLYLCIKLATFSKLG